MMYNDVQIQTAVTVHFLSRQLESFGFVGQYTTES